ncbi:hypothetical protein EJB05_25386, partial [Eragrostis curvula]
MPLPRLAPNPAAILHAALLRASSACRLPPRLSFNSLLAAAATSPHPRLRALALPALALAHRYPDAAGCGPLDSYALCSALRSSPSASAAEPLHALAAKSGWLGSVFVSCALAACYGGSGRFLDARRMFDESSAKNSVFGNAVLAAYIGAGQWASALEFARRFCDLGLQLDGYTMTAVLRACGELANADLGMQAHGHAIRRVGGVEWDVFLTSALVDMYAKCGLVSHVELVFSLAQQENVCRSDVVLWTAMLNAYGRHGQCKEVILTYDLMVDSGVHPDELAMLAVLSACQHAGEVVKGLNYFESIRTDYGLEPTPEHYSCVVNMLCRAGEVAKAWEIATRDGCGSKIGVSTWGALLSACRDCGNVGVGKMAALKAIELEPANVGIYTELSNLYARAGLWEEIDQLREVMKENGLEKDVGFTWVEHVEAYKETTPLTIITKNQNEARLVTFPSNDSSSFGTRPTLTSLGGQESDWRGRINLSLGRRKERNAFQACALILLNYINSWAPSHLVRTYAAYPCLLDRKWVVPLVPSTRLPGLTSATTGQVYEKHFKDKQTGDFKDFHIAYVEFCKYFNTIMPGQDFKTPTLKDIKLHVTEANMGDGFFVMVGLAAPAAAVIGKRASGHIPYVKNMRLDLVPNVVFVPVFTLGAIVAATMAQISRKSTEAEAKSAAAEKKDEESKTT